MRGQTPARQVCGFIGVLGVGLLGALLPLTGSAQQPPAPTWTGSLTIQRCASAPPQLPQQTELALGATLIVRMPDSIGSAVLISPDGFALTAAHVVAGSETVSLLAYGGHALTGQVVRVDEAQDVALIKVHVADGAPCLAPARQRVSLGSDVFVLGSPAGEALSFSVAKGIVSGYRDLGGLQFVQLDAAVNPGNSGGPVVSNAGEIIGIASWKLADVAMEGLSFAVPSDVAISSLELEFADASAADWAAARGRRVASPSAAPAPELGASSDPPVDRVTARRAALRTKFIVSGSILLSVGVIGAAATGMAYYLDFDKRMSQTTWTALQIGNTVGWVLVGTGAAALLTGLVLPKRPKKARGAELSLAPAWGGAVMKGRF